MDFVDRVAERVRLDRLLAVPGGGLAVLWGRRRVGKTRLLLDWVNAAGGVYWMADESSAGTQRRNFAQTMELRLPGFGAVEYPDWATLLSRLAREAKQRRWRGPLVIDELPSLLVVSPELPGQLQRFIDHDAREARLVVALAGSSQRMMQGLVLDGSAPLYGRARELLRLRPLPAGFLGEALGIRAPHEIIRWWAVWGGVPRYWELALEFKELRAAVDSLVLDPMGPLHDEPARLLLEENPPAVALRPVLDAIGAGAHRVSEIGGRVGQPATSLSRPLTRLQELDLVVREIPFGEPPRSSKRALYKLADPFLRLWFQLVAPKRSVLMQVPRSTRLALFDGLFLGLCATAWEELCRQAVPLLAERLGGVEHGPAGRWWSGNGPEWDVVARSVDERSLLVGEVKWLHGEPSQATLEQAVERALRELLGKGAPPLERARGGPVSAALFLPRLPRRRPRLPAGVHLLDAADVLGALRQ